MTDVAIHEESVRSQAVTEALKSGPADAGSMWVRAVLIADRIRRGVWRDDCLPCPICNGAEGCDHSVPERYRAALGVEDILK
jgi:hypothetical protein